MRIRSAYIQFVLTAFSYILFNTYNNSGLPCSALSDENQLISQALE